MPLFRDSREVWQVFQNLVYLSTRTVIIKLEFHANIKFDTTLQFFHKNRNLTENGSPIFKKEAMAERTTYFLIDRDEPMQTQPRSLSNDEFTASRYLVFDQCLREDDEFQY